MSSSSVANLGAGSLGAAFSFPVAENGNDVRLWGTWLDDEIVDQARKGDHPKLRCPLPASVRVFSHDEIGFALDGIDVLCIATSSDGFVPVLEYALPHVRDDTPIIVLTKGFAVSEDRVEPLHSATLRLAGPRPYGVLGGPVKAAELARRIPSATVLGASHELGGTLKSVIETDCYVVETNSDIVGLEVTAALKNVYAIALGIADGLYADSTGDEYHNLPAAIFAHSLEEIAAIVAAVGGERTTVFGLAGVGDLHVTARSGKNREFGELVGRGVPANVAYREMLRHGKQAEGYLALRAALRWIRASYPNVLGFAPIMRTLEAITTSNAHPAMGLTSMLSGVPAQRGR